MRHVRVFISSPSDVSEERAALRKIIDDLQYDPFLRDHVSLQDVSWDRPRAEVPLLASLAPQEAVNRGLPKPSQCDIVVVILWSRLGTPLGPEYPRPGGGYFRSGTEWEFHDAVRSEAATGRPRVLLYHRNSDIQVSLKDPDLADKQEQLKLVGEFLHDAGNAIGSGRPVAINSYEDVTKFASTAEAHLRSVIKGLMDQEGKMDAGPGTPRRFTSSPFPGLRPFSESESLVFFGRERETNELVERLSDPKYRFLAVIGSSGVGKSSLVNAGVIPALRERGAIPGAESWRLLRMTPGEIDGDPFLSLAAALAGSRAAGAAADPQDIAQKLERDPGGFGEYIGGVLRDSPRWAKALLVVDQFEELFASTTDERKRVQFVALLVEAVRSERVVVIVTLRADFYAHCLEHPELAALLRDGSFPLSTAGLGALYRMITRPAELAGLHFQDQLYERIVEDTGAEPGGLALMAFTLNLLYSRAGADGELLVSEYERIGGIRGAIATRAEEIFEHLAPADREQLPTLFRKLTDVGESGAPVRRRARLSVLCQEPATERLVNLLVQARLVVVSDDGHREATAEVAHEALFGSWPRLTEWIQQTQDDMTLLRQLRRAADDWQRSNRLDSFLWPHERLVMVEAMLRNLDPELDPVIEDFIVPEATRILAEVEQPCAHQRRASVGDRLAEIGDPRAGVGLDAEGRPDILWRRVPGGRVRLRDAGEIQVPGFEISAYPVTYRQYRAFLDDPGGFAEPSWFDGLAARPQQPGRQFRLVPNHPAENVSWYDAVAFCRWLSARTGRQVRLPADWEWQLAAAGPGDGSRYCWGERWDDDRANTLECGLGRTVAVGLYAVGATPQGVHDLHGNVWEWCLNRLSDTALDGVDHASQNARVVRGGSWLVARSFARADFRGWDDPELRYPALGFRLVRAGTP
ncbi:SUMF1/EgtB/PvdO family nonheme iron enzyme [Allonocardiopsis opalescens]|uniref:Formylglycine-generating enzyme required for sulfatase activity n=1 Tax=Allonocardiopsis opalescens TaxID=1144618 RepID=A0A2T0Q2H9_9ACTN|nr:SUMF1/EgtB/PvdO family nonheme iron enzyme [Allonocardiopsis opalescens]PRX98002.1 formylglycine-generating enzyme required for sulfatase activity [Allonocardiopsis opalescens]